MACVACGTAATLRADGGVCGVCVCDNGGCVSGSHKAKLMDAAVRLIQFWWWELRQNQALGNGDGAEDLASVVVMLKNVKASLGLTAKRARSLRSPVASASQPAAADNGAGVGPSDAETRSPARSHRRLSQSSAQGVSMTGT